VRPGALIGAAAGFGFGFRFGAGSGLITGMRFALLSGFRFGVRSGDFPVISGVTAFFRAILPLFTPSA
jgi:hypothetical protein